MNSKTKTIFGIVLFAAFIIIAYVSYHALSGGFKPETGTEDTSTVQNSLNQDANKAPDFTVYDGQGNRVKLSDFIGKPVVLNFWASWCPPCKSEMPHFNEVYAEYKDEVTFMMVDLVDGQRETQAKGSGYIKDKGYSFPVYFDNDESAAYAYGISSIPTTLLIDAEGNIVKAYEGAIDKNTLIAGIHLIKK